MLKSTLSTKDFKSGYSSLANNEIALSENLMDGLNIIEGEMVEVVTSMFNGDAERFNAFVSIGEIDSVRFGAKVKHEVFITSYKYMNEDSAVFHKPIRIKMEKND